MSWGRRATRGGEEVATLVAVWKGAVSQCVAAAVGGRGLTILQLPHCAQTKSMHKWEGRGNGGRKVGGEIRREGGT
jgi:hypothetical protein